MKKYIYILLGVFSYQHIIRDILQERGVKNLYTTFAHPNFIPDTTINNRIGMIIFFLLGTLFFYLAFRRSHEA